MTNQVQSASINKLSLQHGLLIGIVSVVLSVVLRIINPVLQATSIPVSLLSFAVVIVLLVVLGLDVRKKIGGFWSFGESFKSLIIMAVFLVIISTAYSFILVKYIDPGLPAKINSAMLDNTTNMLTKFGAEQSKIDEATKQFQDGEFEAKLQPTLKNELTGLGIGLLMYAVINLIIAACIKKKPPLFATAQAYEDPAPES
jgi:uncharacterized membrane protein YvlD (DUF360 family)